MVAAINEAVELEQRAMANPLNYWCVAVTLGATGFAARRVTDRSAKRNGPEIQFEESSSDELVVLGLNG
jgi:hypothetical protein